MKQLLLGFLFLVNAGFQSNAFAGCETRYRDATLALAESMSAFNRGEKTHARLLFEYGEIEAAILANRLDCHSESIDQQQCVLKYKEVYHELRNQVSVYDLVTEVQGLSFQTGVIGKQGKLAWIDLKCQWFR